jgi:imidazoleglycerol-phosphate dehydratase
MTHASRACSMTRTTRETDIKIELRLDGSGQCTIDTGIGMLDHLLTALATHARFDLSLHCKGDLHIDEHHTAEDCAIVLGEALHAALGDRSGITRFAHAYAPLDESLARAVIDLSTRPHASIELGLRREAIGTLSCENIPHVLSSLAMHGRLCLHVDVLRGQNDHHRAEAAFKAVALALRLAVAPSNGPTSTKGVL